MNYLLPLIAHSFEPDKAATCTGHLRVEGVEMPEALLGRGRPGGAPGALDDMKQTEQKTPKSWHSRGQRHVMVFFR